MRGRRRDKRKQEEEERGILNMNAKIPVGKIIRFLSSILRKSRDGFTSAERRAIASDLLELAATIVDGLDDE